APQVSDRTRAAYRELPFTLLQPEHSPDRRSARVVLSGRRAAGTAPRREVAQGGSSDSARAIAETRPQRRGLLRAGFLLSSLHRGFLYPPVRDSPYRRGQRDRADARTGTDVGAEARGGVRPPDVDRAAGRRLAAHRRRRRRAFDQVGAAPVQ